MVLWGKLSIKWKLSILSRYLQDGSLIWFSLSLSFSGNNNNVLDSLWSCECAHCVCCRDPWLDVLLARTDNRPSLWQILIRKEIKGKVHQKRKEGKTYKTYTTQKKLTNVSISLTGMTYVCSSKIYSFLCDNALENHKSLRKQQSLSKDVMNN